MFIPFKDMDGVSDVNIESNSSYEYDKPYEIPKRTSSGTNMEIEFSSNCEANQEMLNKIVGIDKSRLPEINMM